MARKLTESWILAHSRSLDPITEAPEAYVIWAAISVVGAVLKNHVWLNHGTYKIFPNQFIVLVGPPGVGKGTAIHPAHDYAKNQKPPLANYIADRTTAPRIIEKLDAGFTNMPTMVNGHPILQKESSAVLMASELPSLLGASDWMLTFLCDAWDRDYYEYGTKNKGNNVIKDMCVSLMGACVPDFIRKLNKDSTAAINGGFTARTIFVFATEKRRHIAFPTALKDTSYGPQLTLDLEHDLKEIAKLNGAFTIDNEAKDVFMKWYQKETSHKDDDSDVVRHFKSRQATHVFKLGMILSASISDSLIINKWCMQTAIAFTTSVRDTLDITFRGVGESPLAEATAKIGLFIEKKGIVTKAELTKAMHRHCTEEDMYRCISVLETIGEIRGYSSNGKQFFKYIANLKTNGTATP